MNSRKYLNRNDDDDKLIVVPDSRKFSNKEIEALTEFQERFFEHEIIRENIEFNNEYQKKQFMEQLKNNQELLEKFSNDRLKVILQYYLDENNKKRERLKKISN